MKNQKNTLLRTKRQRQLIETTANSKQKEIDDKKIIENYLVHNKTYLTCIPVKIVRHKNPLTFLESVSKYTISFVDAARRTIYFQS